MWSPPNPKPEALARKVKASFEAYAKVNKNIAKDLIAKVSAIDDHAKLADVVASHFSFKIEDKQRLLETTPVERRLDLLVELISLEIEVFRMDQRIKGRIKEQMEKTQKNYYLNEQMRAIRKEMGAEDEAADELQELEKRIKRKRMPREAAGKTRQEFKKLKLMTPMSAEATVVRNYIEWIIRPALVRAQPAPTSISTTPNVSSMRIIMDWKSPRSASSNTWPCSLWSKRSVAPSFAWSALPASVKPPWPVRWPAPPAGDSYVCRWVGCATRPRSEDIVALTSAPCPAKSSNRSKRREPTTRSSASTKWTR